MWGRLVPQPGKRILLLAVIIGVLASLGAYTRVRG